MYLSRGASIWLGYGGDPVRARLEDWEKTVDLANLLFGDGLVGWSKGQPQ